MKKLVQHVKSGKIELIDVPSPDIRPGFVLVKTLYSAISIGTELSLVNLLKSSLIHKARKKPEAIKKVIKMMKRYGFETTKNLINTTLDKYLPLGYSLSGEVISADEESGFEKGDIVACGGSEYAAHQEIALVPYNLCVKVPKDVSPKIASFATIGSIAVWGLREANAVFGEKGLVVGLGLIGSITALFGEFAGIDMYGVDKNPEKIKNARGVGIKAAALSELEIEDFDFVIVAAGSSTSEPLDYALSKVRRRGRVVIIGALPIQLDRNTMYHKEVRISVSRSYGPGRYDPYYEILGYRYPKEYVRWDVKENMRVFLDFVNSRGDIFENMITREFNFEDAVQAYDEIGNGNITAAVFKYGDFQVVPHKTYKNRFVESSRKKKIDIGIIGAGTFISSFILPHLTKEDVNLKIVCNDRPESSYSVAKRFSFEKYTTSVDEVVKEQPDIVIVGTRHDSHGEIVKRLLKEEIPVYVEKPLTIFPHDIVTIEQLLSNAKKAFLYVGFNRRFAPLVQKIRSALSDGLPVTGIIRVNAGVLDKNHWAKVREIGGDRIIGEVCHFIDMAVYLTKSRVKSVFAKSISNGSDFDDNVHIILRMADGSLFSIVYTEWGSEDLGKEYYEVHQGTKSFILHDFRELYVYENGKKKRIRSRLDKGHRNEVREVLRALKTGKTPIPYEDIFNVSYTTFAIKESLRTGEEVVIKGF